MFFLSRFDSNPIFIFFNSEIQTETENHMQQWQINHVKLVVVSINETIRELTRCRLNDDLCRPLTSNRPRVGVKKEFKFVVAVVVYCIKCFEIKKKEKKIYRLKCFKLFAAHKQTKKNIYLFATFPYLFPSKQILFHFELGIEEKKLKLHI